MLVVAEGIGAVALALQERPEHLDGCGAVAERRAGRIEDWGAQGLVKRRGRAHLLQIEAARQVQELADSDLRLHRVVLPFGDRLGDPLVEREETVLDGGQGRHPHEGLGGAGEEVALARKCGSLRSYPFCPRFSTTSPSSHTTSASPACAAE